MTVSLEGAEAWKRAARTPESYWMSREPDGAFKRLAEPIFRPVLSPRFSLDPESRFFCIGSCFARNIEESLLCRRKPVLSKRIYSPRSEWEGRPNGIVNKFTTISMANELLWAFGEADFPQSSFIESQGGWLDLQLAPGHSPVTLERATERRACVREYFQRIANSDVVVLTLGLVEVWRDSEAGVLLNSAPPLWTVKRHPGRFRVELADYAANLAALEQIRDLLRRHAKTEQNLIVSVSPVPLTLTFFGSDVAVANMYSKSVLRAAAGDFCARHDDADYFPSYEMVMMTERSRAFASYDWAHVEERMVSEIMGEFLAGYMNDRTPAPDFNEWQYLLANPDVAEQVRSDVLESGFAHWSALQASASEV